MGVVFALGTGGDVLMYVLRMTNTLNNLGLFIALAIVFSGLVFVPHLSVCLLFNSS
jgi:hypothetical protein